MSDETLGPCECGSPAIATPSARPAREETHLLIQRMGLPIRCERWPGEGHESWCMIIYAAIEARDATHAATAAALNQRGSEASMDWAAAMDKAEAAFTRAVGLLRPFVEAAREIRRVHEAQAAYTRELQELAAEARKTGKSQTHRVQPRVHDYGNGVEMLLLALADYDRSRPGGTR